MMYVCREVEDAECPEMPGLRCLLFNSRSKLDYGSFKAMECSGPFNPRAIHPSPVLPLTASSRNRPTMSSLEAENTILVLTHNNSTSAVQDFLKGTSVNPLRLGIRSDTHIFPSV